ncbi:type II secretion system F family protein [Bordetella sp. N]|uniref:type II secretion system F family protein n=1 Tax=Bordetella sp. N TaxID=1746199 RepID=UPI0007101310|nr:type II secretion system F family protein [Bordetella sp. N]ALM83674.1 pilus assembly protein [Bordetella sp. N]
MTWLIAAGAALSAMLACSLSYGWFAAALTRYRRIYTDEAGLRLSEVFLFVDARQLWTANVLLCVMSAGLLYALTGSVVLALAGGIAPIRATHLLIGRLRRQRHARFDAQLPDTLQALAGGLRAGASVPAALRHIVEQSAPPLAQEFGLMLREQRLGLSFDAALGNLQARLPSEATGLLVSALRVASHSGGNLAETLERIGAMLRARQQLRARVQTLTAQGRLQAWVVGLLAPGMAVILACLDPASMQPLWHTALGWSVLAVVAVLEVVGVWWIRRIVDIDI